MNMEYYFMLYSIRFGYCCLCCYCLQSFIYSYLMVELAHYHIFTNSYKFLHNNYCSDNDYDYFYILN